MVSQVHLVTGAGGGIGLALVDALDRAGHTVWATDQHVEPLQAQASARGWSSRVRCRALDVRHSAGWDVLLEEVLLTSKGLDVVYHLAGVLRPGWLGAIDEAAIRLHVDVNIVGAMLAVSQPARHMTRGAHIVLVSSLAGLAPVPGLALYSASKFAVRGFGLSVASELARRGIAMTVVCPDAVETPMLELQRGREEAELTFSGPRALTATEVAAVLSGRVLRDRPLELALPASRGALARLGGAAPRLAMRLEGALRWVGRRSKHQKGPG